MKGRLRLIAAVTVGGYVVALVDLLGALAVLAAPIGPLAFAAIAAVGGGLIVFRPRPTLAQVSTMPPLPSGWPPTLKLGQFIGSGGGPADGGPVWAPPSAARGASVPCEAPSAWSIETSP